MPTYLRWIAAMTAGISAYFTYSIATLGIATAAGVKELRGALGGTVAFGAWLVTMLVVLGVNDWLARRYPATTRSAGSPSSSEGARAPGSAPAGVPQEPSDSR